MAEKIISPGVFTNEIDQTFLPEVMTLEKCRAQRRNAPGIPTVVTSFSDFKRNLEMCLNGSRFIPIFNITYS